MELILGAGASLLVEWAKAKLGTEGWRTMALLLIVTLVLASGYTYLVSAGYWTTVAEILITAGAFYAFIISNIKK